MTADGKAWRIFTFDTIDSLWNDVTTDQDETFEGVFRSLESFKSLGLDVRIEWRRWEVLPDNPQELLFN